MAKCPKFVPREHIRGLTEAARQILAEELVRDGKMPSFDQVLAAIDETRNEYRAPILAARQKKSGKPLFGQERFNVPEIVPVLYLAAESGDGALKLRCDKFGITTDKTKFLARTLSQGLMLMLGEGPC